MIIWCLNAGWPWIWRIAVTVAALYTVQNVLVQDHKFVNWQTLLAIGTIIVVGIRMWSSRWTS